MTNLRPRSALARTVRSLFFVAAALAVPAVPFLLLGKAFEDQLATWLEHLNSSPRIAAAIVALLAADVLIPVPSSAVSTYAGAKLGVVGGTAASWVGMTAGALIALSAARWLGRRVTGRLTSADDLARIDRAGARLGSTLVVLTRALPLLAEAAVVWVGLAGVSLRVVLPALALSNLGIALAYALLGRFAHERQLLWPALVASVALPVLATLLARRWLPTATENVDNTPPPAAP